MVEDSPTRARLLFAGEGDICSAILFAKRRVILSAAKNPEGHSYIDSARILWILRRCAPQNDSKEYEGLSSRLRLWKDKMSERDYLASSKVWMPHSNFFPPQRPARALDGSSERCVHGSQPMLV